MLTFKMQHCYDAYQQSQPAHHLEGLLGTLINQQIYVNHENDTHQISFTIFQL